MTPDHLREIADRPHVPADAQEALYIAAAKIEGTDRARRLEWERAMLEARANAYGQRSGFGAPQENPFLQPLRTNYHGNSIVAGGYRGDV